jgi:hypothetical protein
MTKGELIKALVDDNHPMNKEICAFAPIPHEDEHGRSEGYIFKIIGIDKRDGDIEIDAWVLKRGEKNE